MFKIVTLLAYALRFAKGNYFKGSLSAHILQSTCRFQSTRNYNQANMVKQTFWEKHLIENIHIFSAAIQIIPYSSGKCPDMNAVLVTKIVWLTIAPVRISQGLSLS